MHLASMIQHYWPFIGGGEKYGQAISEGLASDHHVTVYTTDLVSAFPLEFTVRMNEIRNGVKIFRIPSIKLLAGLYGKKEINAGSNTILRTLGSLDTNLTWPQILLQRAFSSSVPHSLFWLMKEFEDANLIVAFNMITGMTSLSYLASRVKKKPLVIFPFYHVGIQSFEKPSLFRILRDAKVLICSTEYERRAFINKGFDPRKLRVVNEGVKTPVVEDKMVERLEEILDKRQGQLLLMYVGRRDYDKGYPHVLSAVSRLVNSGFHIKLIIAGHGETGAERADYVSLRKHKAILDLGVVDERTKNAAMSLSDATLLPSRAETYPLVFAESWLLGKPVIGARIGSVCSVVREGINGALVEFGDITGLTEAIKSFYNNPQRRYEMGKSGQIYAERELTLEKNIAVVKNIFNELSQGGI